jgi:hypothetical protein
VLDNADTALSPDWWLLRLGRQLRDRRPQLDIWWDYYRGHHPLPEGPRRASEAYRDFQRKARTNFLATIVNASVHRLTAIGIADGDGKSDDEAWGWWKLNRLQARQKQVYRTAFAQGSAFVMVGPHPADERRPLITVEHPREVIVDVDPATGERRVAVKAFYDDVLRVGKASVLLPDGVVKYETDRRGPGRLPWGKENWTKVDEIPHDLGAVPLVPFECRPDLDEQPRAEFDAVIDIQDRINFGVLNRMTSERYSAFRQKYVTGHKFRRVRDLETGIETIEQPFVPDPAALWASEGEDTRFGEFSQTDLLGYLKTHETDVRALLVISQTPAYYYAGDLINVSTDTVAALDTSHVAKVGEYQAEFGASWAEVDMLAAAVAGVGRDAPLGEIRWADPRQLNPAVMADAATKKKSIGYPLAVLAEDLGESPARVNRITSESAADALLAGITAPAPAQSGQPAPAAPAPGA